MQVSTERDVAPMRPILVSEASVAIGHSTHLINRLIDEAVLPDDAWLMVDTRRALRAYAVPMVEFCAADGEKLSKRTRLDAMRHIERFTKENWTTLCRRPTTAEHLTYTSGILMLSLGKPVCDAMTGVNRWINALGRVETRPDIRGGIPVVRGTRVGVHEVAGALSANGLDAVLEDYPSLTRDDVDAAVFYSKAHPKRGRPPSANKHLRLVSEETVDLPERT